MMHVSRRPPTPLVASVSLGEDVCECVADAWGSSFLLPQMGFLRVPPASASDQRDHWPLGLRPGLRYKLPKEGPGKCYERTGVLRTQLATMQPGVSAYGGRGAGPGGDPTVPVIVGTALRGASGVEARLGVADAAAPPPPSRSNNGAPLWRPLWHVSPVCGVDSAGGEACAGTPSGLVPRR